MTVLPGTSAPDTQVPLHRRLVRRMQREFRKATASSRALPDFLIIGFQKGGTSSLDSYLAQHPRLVPADVREVHFFDGGLQPQWVKYAEGERLYRSYFRWQAPLQAQGRQSFEASPCYIFNMLASARMVAMVPDAKLIVLLRDPVERAVSHYFHEKRRGRETLLILDALEAEEERLAPARAEGNYKDPRYINMSYVTRRLYAEQLERIFENYPRDQLLALDSSEFYADSKTALGYVLDFLGLDDTGFGPDLTPVGGATNSTKVEPEVRDWLADLFAKPNKRLFDMLSRRFEWRGAR